MGARYETRHDQHKHMLKCPRTYQCPQVSVYFEIATCLQLMNMLRIVILTLICIFICCAFAGDSYQKSKPGNEKRKSEVSGTRGGTPHMKGVRMLVGNFELTPKGDRSGRGPSFF